MNKVKRFLIGASATAMLLTNAVLPVGAVGSNGSFETGTNPGSFLTVNAGSTDITDWTVDSGSVDYIGTYWQSSDGSRNVDLNGNEQGSISQILTTVIGATYTVNFDLSGNPDGGPVIKTVHVSATGTAAAPYTFDTNGINHADMDWTPKEYEFVATSTSTTLTFASQDEGSYGAAIDNVVVNEDLTTVPTPTPDPFAAPAECTGTYGAPIIGTSAGEVLNGTNGNDLIFALGGGDIVNGKNGNDCIVGGGGGDHLVGGNGNDTILGGADGDSILGNDGMDKLYGEGGGDALKGGADADWISGGVGSDALQGEGGSDTLLGDDGSDAANGNGGTDTCVAEAKTSCEL